MATTKRKRPWLAVLLAFVHPGLGHLYLREWLRAMLWFGLVLVAGSIVIPESAIPARLSVESLLRATERLPLEATVVMFAVTALSMIDAYWLAARNNRAAEESTASGAPGAGRLPDALPGRGGDGTDDVAGAPTTRSCPSCGKELDPDLEFCHWCTTRLDVEEG